jgi:hypothetical protein
MVQTISGAHKGSYTMGTEISSPGVKQAGIEIDHTIPSLHGITFN